MLSKVNAGQQSERTCIRQHVTIKVTRAFNASAFCCDRYALLLRCPAIVQHKCVGTSVVEGSRRLVAKNGLLGLCTPDIHISRMSPQSSDGKATGSDSKTDTQGKSKTTAEEELRASKGKGKMVDPVDADDDEEDEENFDEEAGSESGDDELDDEEEDDDEADEEDEDEEDQPPSKKTKVDEGRSAKAKTASEAGPSSSSKPEASKKRRKGDDDEDEEDAEPETINHASGDEVDTSLIIPGGRRARKGRPQIGGQAKYKYQQKLADSDEDSW